MARLSSTFTGMPSNPPARKRIYRNARTGRRPVPESPNIGDAFHAVTAAARYKEAYEDNQVTIDFLGAVARSWAARKDWRP